MNGWADGFLIVFFFIASALFSGMETGGYLLNRIGLRFRTRRRERSACRLTRILADAHVFIFTVLIGNNIAVYVVSNSVTQLYLRSGFNTPREPVFGFIPWNAETAATLTLMLPLFLFAEMLPKIYFQRNPDILMYRFSGWLGFSQWFFRPLTKALKWFFNILTGGKGSSEALSRVSLSLQGFRDYVVETPEKTPLTDHQHVMIENLVAMHRIPVHQVMQSLNVSDGVSEELSVDEVLKQMRALDVDWLFLYQGSVRNTVGYVELFDLLSPDVNLADPVMPYLRKLSRIPCRYSLSKAFHRMRSEGDSLVVVTDQRSRTVGILNIRDVSQYIVSAS